MWNKDRITYIVPEEWMTSQRLMLFRLDDGCVLLPAKGDAVLVASKDVPLGRHIVLTDATGWTMMQMGEPAKEYHLIRDVREGKRGRWRAMRPHELGKGTRGELKRKPAPEF